MHCMQSTWAVQVVLQGAGDLFCTAACETLYAVRAGGGGLRRALYRLERGVCQQCRCDCHALVERLRSALLLGLRRRAGSCALNPPLRILISESLANV